MDQKVPNFFLSTECEVKAQHSTTRSRIHPHAPSQPAQLPQQRTNPPSISPRPLGRLALKRLSNRQLTTHRISLPINGRNLYAPTPIHRHPPRREASRQARKQGSGDIDVVQGAPLARVDHGGLHRLAGRRAVDADLRAAFGVAVGVAGVGHLREEGSQLFGVFRGQGIGGI